MLLRMKEETDRIDQEVKDIEKWNELQKLEDMESTTSLDSLSNY